ncbi:tetraspanin-18-like [Chrysoperla carnea]|uniref:tetraspanin-18-like n=1 Tax=Chrysoperla carnea TaxID=189513 RepID=UPI001D061AD7|nr:tetraspanin-18-like [Chrysoperla carnea]
MSLNCGACFAKYLLCIFNFIVFLAGTTVLAVGIWLAADTNSFISLMKVVDNEQFQEFTQPTVIKQASYVLIAAGSFMFIVSFLGYCGALRESKCLLTLYGICLVIILAIEITAGGLAVLNKDKAEAETRTFLKTTITKYYATPDKADAVTVMWNTMMRQLSCCGVDNYKDFEDSPKWISEKGEQKLPAACCAYDKNIHNYQNCTSNPSESNSYYETGCFKTLLHWIMQHMDIIIWCVVSLGLIQLFGIFFAFCLCKSFEEYLK